MDRTREYGPGELAVIPRHVPHIFRFVNDTVLAEWWTGSFEARYYRPYRTIVDRATHAMREAKREAKRIDSGDRGQGLKISHSRREVMRDAKREAKREAKRPEAKREARRPPELGLKPALRKAKGERRNKEKAEGIGKVMIKV